MNSNIALLIINVGTPDSPTVSGVRKYLFQFLNDKHVIDLPWIIQKIVVNLFIIPIRAPRSAKLYQKVWTIEGSPLFVHSISLKQKLQNKLKTKVDVYLGMRYQNPSIDNVLTHINKIGYEKIIVLPLFPQYALSTTGTVIQRVFEIIKRWESIPEIKIIRQFYNHPSFIDALAQKITASRYNEFDHIVFSYHGLPIRHLNKVHPAINSNKCTCELNFPLYGNSCYKATCYETTRLLVQKLGLKEQSYSIAFQSRMTNKWMSPYTDQVIRKLASMQIKKVLVVTPSFVTDCLETNVELGIELTALFKQHGGELLTVVSCLNDDDNWVNSICDIIDI